MSCYHCGAETSNGLALCELCRRKAEADLQYLPIYFRNLARWGRPARPNGSLGSRSQWLMRKGEDSDANRIGRALDEAGNDLVGWARMLADDRVLELPDPGETESDQVAALCAWLADHLTSIATLDWCGEFVSAAYVKTLDRGGVGFHEYRLRGLTEASVPGWYAGACRRCKVGTYVVPGLTWVTCAGCGATTYARDHLDTILTEARGWVARPMRLAEAAVALLDSELSVPRLHKRISKWGERGRIDVVRDSDYAPKRFRFGDVLDALVTEGQTRLDDVDTARSA